MKARGRYNVLNLLQKTFLHKGNSTSGSKGNTNTNSSGDKKDGGKKTDVISWNADGGTLDEDEQDLDHDDYQTGSAGLDHLKQTAGLAQDQPLIISSLNRYVDTSGVPGYHKQFPMKTHMVKELPGAEIALAKDVAPAIQPQSDSQMQPAFGANNRAAPVVDENNEQNNERVTMTAAVVDKNNERTPTGTTRRPPKVQPALPNLNENNINPSPTQAQVLARSSTQVQREERFDFGVRLAKRVVQRLEFSKQSLFTEYKQLERNLRAFLKIKNVIGDAKFAGASVPGVTNRLAEAGSVAAPLPFNTWSSRKKRELKDIFSNLETFAIRSIVQLKGKLKLIIAEILRNYKCADNNNNNNNMIDIQCTLI
jgi:hypothetical protein